MSLHFLMCVWHCTFLPAGVLLSPLQSVVVVLFWSGGCKSMRMALLGGCQVAPPSENLKNTHTGTYYYTLYTNGDGSNWTSLWSLEEGKAPTWRHVWHTGIMCGERDRSICSFGTEETQGSPRCVLSEFFACSIYKFLYFFLSYFPNSLHHVTFKWVSEKSCSLPWATQLITSTPPHTHTHRKRLPKNHNVWFWKPKGVGVTLLRGRWEFPHWAEKLWKNMKLKLLGFTF